jgi:hypothetical protein
MEVTYNQAQVLISRMARNLVVSKGKLKKCFVVHKDTD